MICVGSYVVVRLENETRRAIVATIDYQNQEVGLILLREYGNSSCEETLDDLELQCQRWDSLTLIQPAQLAPVSSIVSIDELRSCAAKFFSDRDWRGALSAYDEIIHRLSQARSSPSLLVNEAGAIHIVRRSLDREEYIDHGVIDPTSLSQFIPRMGAHAPISHGSIQKSYRIYSPPYLHATTLLNKGRCLMNIGNPDFAIDSFTYAIYISALSDEPNGRQLRSKAYFWRSRARTACGKHTAALRDSTHACELADDATRPECEIFLRMCRRAVDDEKRGMRMITREIMKICDEQMKQGNIDFSI
jgi:hypothetical protein